MKIMNEYNFNDNDFEILKNILDEIEESRCYEDDDLKSLQKLQKMAREIYKKKYLDNDNKDIKLKITVEYIENKTYNI